MLLLILEAILTKEIVLLCSTQKISSEADALIIYFHWFWFVILLFFLSPQCVFFQFLVSKLHLFTRILDVCLLPFWNSLFRVSDIFINLSWWSWWQKIFKIKWWILLCSMSLLVKCVFMIIILPLCSCLYDTKIHQYFNTKKKINKKGLNFKTKNSTLKNSERKTVR